LIVAAEAARPDETVLAGIRMRMDPQWHTYWQNPGASGLATSIKWNLPEGVTAGDIQWPVPEKYPPDEFATYVYHDEVVLLIPLKLAPGLKPGPLELKGSLSWLECKELCIPGKAEVSATLHIGTETKPSADAKLIQSWQDKLPRPESTGSIAAWWEKPIDDKLRPLVIAARPGQTDFYPEASDRFEVQGATEIDTSNPGRALLRKVVKSFDGSWPREISGLLVSGSPDNREGVQVRLAVNERRPADASPGGFAPNANAAPASPAKPLWEMLLYAFLGGLILNIMPCVLPVIALKVLGFVSEARSDPRRVRRLGLIYALGVLVSFLALAGMVIAIQAAGRQAGWGMQFSNPGFVFSLTVLVTLVALNLFGVFEVTLGGRAMGAAGELAAQKGATGAFFNGFLATALATPCTAPLLSGALGFAFAQSAPLIVLFFLTVGAGLAAPYVVLSWNPGWLKFIPKPGAWMEKFKIAMGFPMLATAVWLFYLAFGLVGKRALWLGFFLVLVALAAWIYGEFVQRGRRRRGFALAVSLAVAIGGFGMTWHQLRAKEVAWQPWSPQAVAAARAKGRPVLVDFTADWCVTCNTIVKPALESASVQKRLKDLNAVSLLADYTRTPPEMTEELKRFGRAGVPLVLLYPADSNAPPAVLPDALTAGMVLDALNRAAN